MIKNKINQVSIVAILALVGFSLSAFADDCHVADQRNVIENNYGKAVSVSFNGAAPITVPGNKKISIDNPQFASLSTVKVMDSSGAKAAIGWSGSVAQKDCTQMVCISHPSPLDSCTSTSNCDCAQRKKGKTIIKVVVTGDFKIKVYNT